MPSLLKKILAKISAQQKAFVGLQKAIVEVSSLQRSQQKAIVSQQGSIASLQGSVASLHMLLRIANPRLGAEKLRRHVLEVEGSTFTWVEFQGVHFIVTCAHCVCNGASVQLPDGLSVCRDIFLSTKMELPEHDFAFLQLTAAGAQKLKDCGKAPVRVDRWHRLGLGSARGYSPQRIVHGFLSPQKRKGKTVHLFEGVAEPGCSGTLMLSPDDRPLGFLLQGVTNLMVEPNLPTLDHGVGNFEIGLVRRYSALRFMLAKVPLPPLSAKHVPRMKNFKSIDRRRHPFMIARVGEELPEILKGACRRYKELLTGIKEKPA